MIQLDALLPTIKPLLRACLARQAIQKCTFILSLIHCFFKVMYTFAYISVCMFVCLFDIVAFYKVLRLYDICQTIV